MNTYLQPLSRVLLALLFIFRGFGKIPGFAMVSGMMEQKGFPAPGLFLAAAVIIELLGGLLLLIGYKARFASLALIIFLIPATVIFHMAAIDGTQAGQMEIAATLKNLALIGGLLQVIINGAGAYAVDSIAPRGMKSVTAA